MFPLRAWDFGCILETLAQWEAENWQFGKGNMLRTLRVSVDQTRKEMKAPLFEKAGWYFLAHAEERGKVYDHAT